MKNILITGIRGFIGFNAIQLWKKIFPNYKYVGLDANTYADKFMMNVKNQWLDDNCIPYYVVDLADSSSHKKLVNIVKTHNIDTVVNFAAESHVDRSITNPNVFFESNILGTVNLLNLAKDYNLRYHQVSTDEVYGITYPEDECDEEYHIDPSSPYSSSKASADLIVMSYVKTFKINATISRCSNNFGPWQMTEKLIPTVISNARVDKSIPVYGKGNQRRHWIYVDDHNASIMDILQIGKRGEIYNIAPTSHNYISNMSIIKRILKIMGKPTSLIEHVTDRAAHDTSYFLCTNKKYRIDAKYEKNLALTVSWYLKNL